MWCVRGPCQALAFKSWSVCLDLCLMRAAECKHDSASCWAVSGEAQRTGFRACLLTLAASS